MNDSKSKLMKKTKAELCDIILRKDDDEIKLKKQVSNLTECMHKANKNELDATINFREISDDYAEAMTDIADKNVIIKRLMIAAIVELTIIVVLLAI